MYQNQHTGNRYNGNNQCQPAETSITKNRTLQSMIMKKEGVFMDVAISGEKCDKEISREYYKIRSMYYRNTGHLECNNKGDAINITVTLYHLIMIQKKPEHHIG